MGLEVALGDLLAWQKWLQPSAWISILALRPKRLPDSATESVLHILGLACRVPNAYSAAFGH